MVQQTFLRLWRNADRFDPARATVARYLFVIARSVIKDILKRPVPVPVLDPESSEPARDCVDQILRNLIVREALDSLSAAHREVLTMAYQEDLTRRQIAERLGVPPGTVATRMFHGLRALRAALAERGLDDSG